ncbi:hypothetical protein FHG87_011512 [Trinorchestia longiramus]|nr:hypothetical protein FHG87_011512 [Trinorchestia longiramus]
MRIAEVGVAFCILTLAGLSSAEVPGSDRRDGGRVIAKFSTWTQLSFVTSTTVVPRTCAYITNVACKKRKKRSFGNLLKSMKVANADTDGVLEGSLASPRADGELDGSQRDPKIALTVWRSHTSTFTMIMTSTNLAITLSLSFACSIVGGNFPELCPA